MTLGTIRKSLAFIGIFLFIQVQATDADEGVNGRVWYRIVKGKSRFLFAAWDNR